MIIRKIGLIINSSLFALYTYYALFDGFYSSFLLIPYFLLHVIAFYSDKMNKSLYLIAAAVNALFLFSIIMTIRSLSPEISPYYIWPMIYQAVVPFANLVLSVIVFMKRRKED
jgi:hypothetical protein